MTVDMAAQKLTTIVRDVFSKHREAIDEHRTQGALMAARPDFLWHILLQSFATMGNSRGQFGLIHNQANYQRLRYDVLAAYNDEDRRTEISEVCAIAGIRMPRKKAGWIASAFLIIRELGGPEAAKSALMAEPTKAEKEKFLMRFPGIGEKYARNIMMDIHHEQFRSSIAIDVRVGRISKALGVEFSRPYPDHEAFYLNVADRAGMTGWELDRLLYNHADEVELAVSRLNG